MAEENYQERFKRITERRAAATVRELDKLARCATYKFDAGTSETMIAQVKTAYEAVITSFDESERKKAAKAARASE